MLYMVSQRVSSSCHSSDLLEKKNLLFVFLPFLSHFTLPAGVSWDHLSSKLLYSNPHRRISFWEKLS